MGSEPGKREAPEGVPPEGGIWWWPNDHDWVDADDIEYDDPTPDEELLD